MLIFEEEERGKCSRVSNIWPNLIVQDPDLEFMLGLYVLYLCFLFLSMYCKIMCCFVNIKINSISSTFFIN